MIFSGIDWVVMWRLFHHLFFWIYLALGIPLRAVVARRFGAAGTGKTSPFALAASVASAAFNTWFPILPVACVIALDSVEGDAAGQSFFIGVPLVAVAMATEGALVDAVLFRVLLKESVKKRFVSLLIANVLNSSIALALSLTWAFHHLRPIIATANSCQ
jgi:hypothetical protein